MTEGGLELAFDRRVNSILVDGYAKLLQQHILGLPGGVCRSRLGSNVATASQRMDGDRCPRAAQSRYLTDEW
jgi:hypothetical protein